MSEKPQMPHRSVFERRAILCVDEMNLFESSWTPVIRSFYLGIEVDLGEAGVDGADIHSIVVASPEYVRSGDHGSNVLILPILDGRLVECAIDSMVRIANSTHDPHGRLREMFHWEFEGMR